MRRRRGWSHHEGRCRVGRNVVDVDARLWPARGPLSDPRVRSDARGGDAKAWRLVADPPTLPNVLTFSAAMGAVQWQTSRMTHPVRFRNPAILLRSKRAGPTRPTGASFAFSSPTAAM